MNKLRLIKPWYLHPIHQRLEGIANHEVTIITAIPCTGPVGELPEQNTVRKEGNISSNKKPNNAPVSDAIFASVCNKNIR